METEGLKELIPLSITEIGKEAPWCSWGPIRKYVEHERNDGFQSARVLHRVHRIDPP